MLSLSRNLFDDLSSLHRAMDSLFDRTLGSFTRDFTSLQRPLLRGFTPEFETYAKNNQLVYRLAIPGVDPKDVDLSILGNQVTVKAERKAPSEVKEENWQCQSFYYGTFEQLIALPEGAETEEISATFNNGVLEIFVPLAKAHLARKIELKQIGSGGQKAQLKAAG
jgi:HSP20 family protein